MSFAGGGAARTPQCGPSAATAPAQGWGAVRSHVLGPRGRVGGADAGPVVGDVTGDSRRPWECSRASSGAVARAWRGRRVAGRWPAAWRGQSVTEELGAGHAGGTGWTRAEAVQLDEEEFLGTVGGDIAGWGRPCASVPRPSAVRPGQPSLEPAERTVRRRVAGRLGRLCEAICGRPGLAGDPPWEEAGLSLGTLASSLLSGRLRFPSGSRAAR